MAIATITANASNYLDQSLGTNHNGAGTLLFGALAAGAANRPIIVFDTSTIPSGAHILAVSLTFNVTDITFARASQPMTISIIRQSDYNTTQSTWTIYKTAGNWNTLGAGSATVDQVSSTLTGNNMPTTTGVKTFTGFETVVNAARALGLTTLPVWIRWDTDLTAAPGSTQLGIDGFGGGTSPTLIVTYVGILGRGDTSGGFDDPAVSGGFNA